MTDRESVCLTFQALRPEQADLFLSVIEAVLPHRQPELEFPRQVSALVLDAQMVTNLGMRELMLDGMRALDQYCQREHHSGFAALSAEEQAAALRQQEDTPFFQTLIHIVKSDFYNRHLVWRVLGYPDLDREDGYLDHGFDQLPVVTPATSGEGGSAQHG